jgi:hypothetical protein
MGMKWKGDTLWSLAAASLRDACDNPELAEAWKASFLNLCNQDRIRKDVEHLPASDITRLLLHSLGRGHALIKQALEWENPSIGKKESKSNLDKTRGAMWRFQIAYCGWDRSTNSLGINQAAQEYLIAESMQDLNSPELTDNQRRQILAWLPKEDELLTTESSVDGKWINDFLGIKDNYHDFPFWIVGNKPMKQAALLAVLRNIVAHGSLLPTKAKNWGLEAVYENGVHVIAESFEVLLSKLIPKK